MREHNRIAAALSQLNPYWTDETLFQEARRIVIAEYQFIVYKEFLPVVLGSIRKIWFQVEGISYACLGKRYMDRFKLSTPDSKSFFGNADDYDAHINPSIQNEFATAAYRMGHSLIQGMVKWVSIFNNFDIRSTYGGLAK